MNKYFNRGGHPFFVVGVNYWPRQTGPLMWQNWNPDSVRGELIQMKELGANVIRSFLFWPDFMPRPGAVDPVMMQRLEQFLSLCKEAELQTAITFFVGHMSGENWDLPWRGGRDFYTDPWMLGQERIYLGQVAGTFAKHPAVFAWILSNELPLWVGVPDETALQQWAHTMVMTIRAVDRTHPVSVGDGALEGLGARSGFQSPNLSALMDFVGCHVYVTETDALRHSYAASAMVRALEGDRPVLLEEFGCSTSAVSEENQAGYFRTTLHSAMAAGAAGAWAWCYSDFDLPSQRPYATHPAELTFGITRADGTQKPSAGVMAEFAELAKKVDWSRFAVPPPTARILVPSSRGGAHAIPPAPSAEAVSRILLQTYVIARQAGLSAGFLYEPPIDCGPHATVVVDYRWLIPETSRLLVLPAIPDLSAPAWDHLEGWVRDGGTLYCSYQRGCSPRNFETLFGCRHSLRYGLPDVPPAQIELTFKRPFGPLAAGEKLHYGRTGDFHESGLCPVQPTTAEVLAQDGEGRPALLLNRLDAGKVIFACYPLEAYLSRTPEVHKRDASYRLYQGLMAMAGIQPVFLFSHPSVECAWLQGECEYLVWLINHSWERVEGTLITPSAAPTIEDVMEDQLATTRFALDPKQVRVVKVIA